MSPVRLVRVGVGTGVSSARPSFSSFALSSGPKPSLAQPQPQPQPQPGGGGSLDEESHVLWVVVDLPMLVSLDIAVTALRRVRRDAQQNPAQVHSKLIRAHDFRLGTKT